VRFERDERAALRPLPSLPLPVREQRLRRKVALDALVDLDTVRYSVPFRLVRESVEVVVGAHEVRIFHGTAQVAQHERSFEPYARVIDPAHYEGLWRARDVASAPATPSGGLEALGRSLDVYAAIVGEEAQS
jgi:hypothetical protein